MGLLEFLSNVVLVVVDKAEQQASRQASRQSRGGSALPSGRMRETDKVKGTGAPIPNKPGMYRHRDKSTGEVQYVGQSNNLRKRQQEHAREGKLNTDKQYVQYGAAKSTACKDDLCRAEVDHIARHEPSGNTTKGGNGRR